MHIKKFESFNKLNEAGEWNRYITWAYVKDNPDCNDDECQIIKGLEEDMEDIKELLSDDSIFILKDISGFDMYQGAYARVEIYGKNYEIWKNDETEFYIEDFPITNMDEDQNPGFIGDKYDIAEVINNFEFYMKSKKYNI
ncbi:hypothetical protein M0Q97_11655 [Candidatus Dojkabacteria bacterium]|jgi:hypothetical protein|nr:hypothetical protein [Candidatus Dojkabacteria bacterium]